MTSTTGCYASACYSLATLAEAAGDELSLEAVLPTAELCQDVWAETLSRVFSARVLPYHGCGEVIRLVTRARRGAVITPQMSMS
jgi:hypothetical protein